MESTTINAIIAGVVGLTTGAIGSLIAPWVQWGVEKRRKKNDRRIDLIQRVREILSQENFSRSILLNDPIYGALRCLLNEKARKEIERSANHFVVAVNSPTSNSDRDLILREIAEIEKSWGLL